MPLVRWHLGRRAAGFRVSWFRRLTDAYKGGTLWWIFIMLILTAPVTLFLLPRSSLTSTRTRKGPLYPVPSDIQMQALSLQNTLPLLSRPVVRAFVNLFASSVPERVAELVTAFDFLLRDPSIDRVHVFVDEAARTQITQLQDPKVIIIPFDGRPSFNEYFDHMNEYPSDINMILNADTFFEPMTLVETMKWWPLLSASNAVYALSRWEYSGALETATFEDTLFSQDAWIFFGNTIKHIPGNFTLGQVGCDNKFMYELLQAGYRVFNPSHSVRLMHYHVSAVRNKLTYNQKPEFPWNFLWPHSLDDMLYCIVHNATAEYRYWDGTTSTDGM